MRVLRSVVTIVMLLCVGCSSPVIHARAGPQPEPREPDLGAVMERYYEAATSGHWLLVHGMLSQRLGARLDGDALRRRYGPFRDARVRIADAGPKTIRTILRTPVLQTTETATLRWDSDRWEIDSLAPASLVR